MFGMGMGELLLILVVALLVVGPDKLPQAAKAIGKGIRDFRRHSLDLQSTLEQDEKLGEAVRELRSALHDDPFRVIRQPPHPPASRGAASPPSPAAGAESVSGSNPGAGSGGAADPASETPSIVPAEGIVAKEAARPIDVRPDPRPSTSTLTASAAVAPSSGPDDPTHG